MSKATISNDPVVRYLEQVNPKPLLGFAFIRLESYYKPGGDIVIPERYKVRPGYVGKVIAVAVNPDTQREYLELLSAGDRVVVRALGGTVIFDDMYRFHVNNIVAIVGDDVAVDVESNPIERCQFCGPAGSGVHQGVILVEGPGGKLYCPKCRKNQYGDVIDPMEIPDMSDDDAHAFMNQIRRA